MNTSKRLLKRYYPFFLTSFLVFITAETAHYIFWGKFFFFLINSLIMSVYVVYWPFSRLDSRLNKVFKRYRTAIAAVMLFWLFLKCAKDRFLMENEILPRFSWYAYYVAIILLPLLCYEFSLQFDQSSSRKYRIRVLLLRISAVVLIAAIITNDLHYLAFSFPGGIDVWNSNYSRGPLYFVAAAYGIILFMSAIAHIFRQCTLPKSKKYIWLPLIPLAVGIVFTIMYFFNFDPRINGIRIFSLTDVFCFLIMVFIDACEVVYQIATEFPDEEALVLHHILGEIEPQMDKAEKRLDESKDSDEEQYRANLFCAGFYQTYAKRVANLILLAEQNENLDFDELTLSLAESVEYMKLGGLKAILITEGNKDCSISELLTIYHEFENRIEPVLLKISAALIYVTADKNGISMRILAEDCEGNEL